MHIEGFRVDPQREKALTPANSRAPQNLEEDEQDGSRLSTISGVGYPG